MTQNTSALRERLIGVMLPVARALLSQSRMSESTAAPPASGDSLDRSALRGVAWSSAAKWSTQLFAWGGTILVARILVPEDIGLLMTASVFMGVVMVLSEFGIGTAVITLRHLPAEEMTQLNSFSVILGAGGTLLAAAMAYPLGLFFRAPQLPPVLMVVGLTFLFSSLQTVPSALLRRELRFRTIAGIEVVRGLVVPAVTLAGALAGMRYWALALGGVIGAVITAALTLYHRHVGFARPSFAGLRPVLTFSRHVLVGRLAWIVYQNGDFAVAGRRLSMASVGDYGMAWTLATSPIEKVTTILADVTPALFSAAQHDKAALRRYFLNLSELLCLALLPVAVGIAIVSHDLVDVVLGEKWRGAAGPLALLALYAGTRSVTTLFGHLFNATRETRFAMWSSIALAILLLTGFIVGSRWGPSGIAAAWLIVHPGFSVYSFTRVRRVLEMDTSSYLRALRLGVDGSVIMAAALLAFQMTIAVDWPTWLRLLATILLGVAVFIGVTLAIHGARLRAILSWLRRVRRGEQV